VKQAFVFVIEFDPNIRGEKLIANRWRK
jgi:hypothetical protein